MVRKCIEIVVRLSSLALPGLAMAQEAPNFEQHKAVFLQNIDEQISRLQQAKACRAKCAPSGGPGHQGGMRGPGNQGPGRP